MRFAAAVVSARNSGVRSWMDMLKCVVGAVEGGYCVGIAGGEGGCR